VAAVDEHGGVIARGDEAEAYKVGGDPLVLGMMAYFSPYNEKASRQTWPWHSVSTKPAGYWQ
jgi:hypothetical protein